MSEFKVGDRVIEKSTKKLKQIPQCKTENTKATLAMYGRLCELWQPQVGEWCWFRTYTDETLTLIKWKNSAAQNESLSLSRCEPFLDSLPSFIKDRG